MLLRRDGFRNVSVFRHGRKIGGNVVSRKYELGWVLAGAPNPPTAQLGSHCGCDACHGRHGPGRLIFT